MTKARPSARADQTLEHQLQLTDRQAAMLNTRPRATGNRRRYQQGEPLKRTIS